MHYDKERIREEQKLKRGKEKPKLTLKGEITFIVALAFVVLSLVLLFGVGGFDN